jgi:hypothetical protein
MYTVSRKNGSFPGGKRTLRFFTYDEMRVFLRSYFRNKSGIEYRRSTHPSMRTITHLMNLVIKKGI